MGENYDLTIQLLQECRLLERVLDAERNNKTHEQETGSRFGYMGFITQIANTISTELGGDIEDLAKQIEMGHLLDEWTHFVENDLKKRNFVEEMYKCGEVELPQTFSW